MRFEYVFVVFFLVARLTQQKVLQQPHKLRLYFQFFDCWFRSTNTPTPFYTYVNRYTYEIALNSFSHTNTVAPQWIGGSVPCEAKAKANKGKMEWNSLYTDILHTRRHNLNHSCSRILNALHHIPIVSHSLCETPQTLQIARIQAHQVLWEPIR